MGQTNNTPSANLQTQFTASLLRWFDQFGRKDLPWQRPRTPYRVYISEIMLQQTQVKTALPYFEKFIHRFPTIEALALATEDEVLAHWSGLGYYSRARNLHKTAILLTNNQQNELPKHPNQLTQLPGIGPSTAAAIASLAYGLPFPILDGNVKRVLARYFMVEGVINQTKTEQRLMAYAEQCMSKERCADYTQAIMDLGALCCKPKQPTCSLCPLQQTCAAYQQGCVEAFPFPHPKKKLPTHTWQFFMFYRSLGQEKPAIYLEKRQPQGIWGGLWCLPVHAITPSSNDALVDPFNLNQNEIIHLEPFKHTFTHFHLQVHGIKIALKAPHPNLNEKQWFHEQDLMHLGLPKPVKTLLTNFWTSK